MAVAGHQHDAGRICLWDEDMARLGSDLGQLCFQGGVALLGVLGEGVPSLHHGQNRGTGVSSWLVVGAQDGGARVVPVGRLEDSCGLRCLGAAPQGHRRHNESGAGPQYDGGPPGGRLGPAPRS